MDLKHYIIQLSLTRNEMKCDWKEEVKIISRPFVKLDELT